MPWDRVGFLAWMALRCGLPESSVERPGAALGLPTGTSAWPLGVPSSLGLPHLPFASLPVRGSAGCCAFCGLPLLTGARGCFLLGRGFFELTVLVDRTSGCFYGSVLPHWWVSLLLRCRLLAVSPGFSYCNFGDCICCSFAPRGLSAVFCSHSYFQQPCNAMAARAICDGLCTRLLRSVVASVHLIGLALLWVRCWPLVAIVLGAARAFSLESLPAHVWIRNRPLLGVLCSECLPMSWPSGARYYILLVATTIAPT